MIYVVTKEQRLFDSDFKIIGVDESLSLLNQMSIIQFDTETTGRDAHICKLLSLQFGNDAMDCRIVVDATTTNVLLYKDILESKYIIGQNLKFDLQFLYQYGIHPTKVYDTMIVEQFLYLGYPSGLCISKERYAKYQYTFPYHITSLKDSIGTYYTLSYALDAIAKKRLGVTISKEIRGQIIYRGLDDEVIKYAANDVVYLEKIMKSQLEDIKKIPNAIHGAKLECDFVPCIAYLEWCGIKLDENKWRAKMDKDLTNYREAKKNLDNFLVKTPLLKAFWHINLQGDLFEGFSDEPIIDINWSSSEQVIKVAKILGFNTTTKNKLTGEDTDSVIEKQLISQKGINDEFLDLYFKHQEYKKVVTSFGQGHIDAINPITGRIHTVYRALGTVSGRMSSGSSQSNTDLAKYKHLVPSACKYPNMQQLPHDEETRACFVSEPNNLFCSCDYSAKLNFHINI